MHRPAQIKEWMSRDEMLVWLREAPNRHAYQKRLVIWLVRMGRFYAHEIAEMLGVSKQAIWLWISQYNRHGPCGIHGQGRGGRHWSFLSWETEVELLQGFETRAQQGEVITVKQLFPAIEEKVGKKISLGYVYKLLRRHQWRKLGPRPHHVQANLEEQEAFKKNSRRLFKT